MTSDEAAKIEQAIEGLLGLLKNLNERLNIQRRALETQQQAIDLLTKNQQDLMKLYDRLLRDRTDAPR